jgi:transcriptional regulator with XRE-family HTH domain
MKPKAIIDDDPLITILEIIGKKFHELRIQKGYKSSADFASDHGLPRIQYWRMERGKANMTIKSLNKILAIHGLSIEDLFTIVLKESKNNTVEKAPVRRNRAA